MVRTMQGESCIPKRRTSPEAIDREDANECGRSITRVTRRERSLEQWREIVTREIKGESRETENEGEIESKCEGEK